jgi:hypothetical protein
VPAELVESRGVESAFVGQDARAKPSLRGLKPADFIGVLMARLKAVPLQNRRLDVWGWKRKCPPVGEPAGWFFFWLIQVWQMARVTAQFSFGNLR